MKIEITNIEQMEDFHILLMAVAKGLLDNGYDADSIDIGDGFELRIKKD